MKNSDLNNMQKCAICRYFGFHWYREGIVICHGKNEFQTENVLA